MTPRKEEGQCSPSTASIRPCATGGNRPPLDTPQGDSTGTVTPSSRFSEHQNRADGVPSKTCPSCATSKPVERFSRHSKRADGLQSVCKDCELVYRRRTQGASDVKRNFHMTLDQRAAMLAGQGGGCAICGESEKRLVVDHDQSCCPSPDRKNARACGECTRGILCNRCNTSLGRYRDDPSRMREAGWGAAAEYIDRYHARRVQLEQAAS